MTHNAQITTTNLHGRFALYCPADYDVSAITVADCQQDASIITYARPADALAGMLEDTDWTVETARDLHDAVEGCSHAGLAVSDDVTAAIIEALDLR